MSILAVVPAALWALIPILAAAGGLGASEYKRRKVKKLERERGKLGMEQSNEVEMLQNFLADSQKTKESGLASPEAMSTISMLLERVGQPTQEDVDSQLAEFATLDMGGKYDAGAAMGRQMASAIGSSPQEIKDITTRDETFADRLLATKRRFEAEQEALA